MSLKCCINLEITGAKEEKYCEQRLCLRVANFYWFDSFLKMPTMTFVLDIQVDANFSIVKSYRKFSPC